MVDRNVNLAPSGAVANVLGLDSGGNLVKGAPFAVTASATDTTPGAVTKVGDFGLGAQTLPDFSCNAAGLPTRIGRISADGSPDGTSFWHTLHMSRLLDAQGAQIGVKDTGVGGSSEIAARHRDFSGAWSAWNVMFGRRNVIGTVAQSGGVPTGALIETGSNANGDFVKFADGTMICSRALTASAGAAVTWTFPAAFIAAPAVTGSAIATVMSCVCLDSAATATNVALSARDKTDARRADVMALVARGRWF